VPLKYKVLALAILPLLVTMGIVAARARYHSEQLAGEQAQLIEDSLLAAKQHELQNYVAVALSALAPMYAGPGNERELQAQAKAILASTHYADNGYFFVYDQDGICLVHPTMPELVGQDLRRVTDSHGRHVIPDLIETARRGGGFQRYSWQKPSTQEVAEKLAYVALLPRWGWVVGTGVYLDDIDRASGQLRERSNASIRGTLGSMGLLALCAVIVVFVGGMTLNASQHRLADSKLKAMAQRIVSLQEEERARVSRELHDGVSQLLVAAKFHFEAVRRKCENTHADVLEGLELGLCRLAEGLSEVRGVSHEMRPPALELGLAVVVRQFVEEFARRSRIQVTFQDESGAVLLSEAATLALFRITQQGLANVEQSAKAEHAWVQLARHAGELRLTIHDDGCGFDVAKVFRSADSGIGLRNMRERIEHLGGRFSIRSQRGSTELLVALPIGTKKGSHAAHLQ